MTPGAVAVYEITVAGHLDDHWSGRLAGLRVERRLDGTTTLTGPLADQAQLHGVILGLRDIGVVLLGLRTVDHDASGPSPASPTATGGP